MYAPRERKSAKYEQQPSTFNNNFRQVQWKELLEEVHQIENPKQLLKRPTYIINIIYNNHGIYLSKCLQFEKPSITCSKLYVEKLRKENHLFKLCLEKLKKRQD
jgi:hypothetical protein